MKYKPEWTTIKYYWEHLQFFCHFKRALEKIWRRNEVVAQFGLVRTGEHTQSDRYVIIRHSRKGWWFRNALHGLLEQCRQGQECRSGRRRRYRVGSQHFELIEGP